jgi:hypothetical protein
MSKAFITQEVPGQSINENDVKSCPSGTIVGTTDTQTLTNKTFTTPAVTESVQTLAAAGNSISDGGAITVTSPGLVFVTGADATKGVQLPVAAAGKRIFVKNDTAANAVLKVYPQVNSTINVLSANTAISMAANTSAMFYGYNATSWITIPTVPS